jgi:hypothetical protein
VARLVLGAGFACSAAVAVHAQWYFEVGPVYRGDMEVSVQGGSSAAESGATAARAGTVGGKPSLPASGLNDDGTAQVLREFDDGYVGPSGWEWARNEGWTQFWAYDSPAQYNADADTLTFQVTMGEVSATQRRTTTRTWTDSVGWTGHSRTDGFGVMGTLGYMLRNEGDWSLGAQARFGWLDGIRSEFRDRPAFRQSVERSVYEASIWRDETTTYTYDTLGNPAFPAAPYAMTDPAAVGPMIGDTPESITRSSQEGSSDRLVSRSVGTAVSTVDLKVEAQAFTVQLGPRLLWEPEGRVAFLVQPALTANLLDADMRRQETFRQPNGTAVASWHDSSDKQAWRMGAGVEVGALVALSEQWHVTASGGYEWVDKYSLNAGPDHIRLDLSGYQLEVAIGRSF